MASRGDDERRVKRRFDPNALRDKQVPRRGSGRSGVGGRESRDYQIQQEEALQMAGRVIPPNACLATPPHIEQYDGAYMVD